MAPLSDEDEDPRRFQIHPHHDMPNHAAIIPPLYTNSNSTLNSNGYSQKVHAQTHAFIVRICIDIHKRTGASDMRNTYWAKQT